MCVFRTLILLSVGLVVGGCGCGSTSLHKPEYISTSTLRGRSPLPKVENVIPERRTLTPALNPAAGGKGGGGKLLTWEINFQDLTLAHTSFWGLVTSGHRGLTLRR